MKKIIIISVLFLAIFNSFGQNASDSIQIKKSFGTVFQQHDKKLTPRQMLEITKTNPDAYAEMKIAKNNYGVGSVLGFAGGFLVGWTLGSAIGGDDPQWALAGIGAGLIAVSIPFNAATLRHAKKAVQIYNDGLRQTTLNKINCKVGLAYNGIGVKLTF